MSVPDIGIIIIIILFMFNSYRIGFFEEILSLLSLIISSIAAYIFSPLLVPYITFFTENLFVLRIIAAGIIFTVVYLFFKLIREGMFDFLEETSLSTIDRLLGLILGFLKGVIFTSFFIFILYQINIKFIIHILNNSIFSKLFLEAFWKYKEIALLSWS